MMLDGLPVIVPPSGGWICSDFDGGLTRDGSFQRNTQPRSSGSLRRTNPTPILIRLPTVRKRIGNHKTINEPEQRGIRQTREILRRANSNAHVGFEGRSKREEGKKLEANKCPPCDSISTISPLPPRGADVRESILFPRCGLDDTSRGHGGL